MTSVAFAESVQYTLGTVETARRVQQDTGEQLDSWPIPETYKPRYGSR